MWLSLGLALAALAAGCLGGAKTDPRYYTLSPPAGSSAGAPLAGRPELSLAVGPLDFPRYLDRPELVTRTGSHGLVVWADHRWGGSLSNDILRVVADDLGELLGTVRIAVYPNEPGFAPDVRVGLVLLELDGAPGAPVRLRARWTLAGVDGRTLAVSETRAEQTPASPSMHDLVAAQTAVLGVMSREIAERIQSLRR
ncbi:MAG: PqiC family protein [Myxococcota bacterium]